MGRRCAVCRYDERHPIHAIPSAYSSGSLYDDFTGETTASHPFDPAIPASELRAILADTRKQMQAVSDYDPGIILIRLHNDLDTVIAGEARKED